MEASKLESLKYPKGRFHPPGQTSSSDLSQAIEVIAHFPAKIREMSQELSLKELQWPYRPGGWMIKQVIHHCADSHMNAFIRFKWALTEEKPRIKAYQEADWAELPDAQYDEIEDSLILLEGLHRRWVKLLHRLSEADWQRTFIHPEGSVQLNLKRVALLYAWHCEHHEAHIAQALSSQGAYGK